MIYKINIKSLDTLKNDLLDREEPEMPEQKLLISITSYPAFQYIRSIIEELHILLTP